MARLPAVVRSAVWLMALLLTSGPVLAVEALAMRQVARGIYVAEGAVEPWQPANLGHVANLGFVVGERCVAVVDSGGSPEVGRRLRAAVAGATALPVCFVITTHAHPDHLLGSAAFAEAPPPGPAGLHFVAHARLAATLAAREQGYRKAFEREFGQALTPADIVYPTLVVQDRLEIDLGQRSLLLQAWPTAHTDNDLSVWDAQTGTLFTGDLLFVEHIPVLDGSLPGWLAVMDRLQSLPVTLAIPGHGAPSADWPAVLAPQRAYLSALKRQTEAALGRHLSLSQALSEASLPPDWRLAELFHRRNLTAAYAELEWAD